MVERIYCRPQSQYHSRNLSALSKYAGRNLAFVQSRIIAFAYGTYHSMWKTEPYGRSKQCLSNSFYVRGSLRINKRMDTTGNERNSSGNAGVISYARSTRNQKIIVYGMTVGRLSLSCFYWCFSTCTCAFTQGTYYPTYNKRRYSF